MKFPNRIWHVSFPSPSCTPSSVPRWRRKHVLSTMETRISSFQKQAIYPTRPVHFSCLAHSFPPSPPPKKKKEKKGRQDKKRKEKKNGYNTGPLFLWFLYNFNIFNNQSLIDYGGKDMMKNEPTPACSRDWWILSSWGTDRPHPGQVDDPWTSASSFQTVQHVNHRTIDTSVGERIGELIQSMKMWGIAFI